MIGLCDWLYRGDGMVGWNGIFRLFRFSGVLGQPREVHPKFRKEIPENVCSIRFPTRNFRNFWSNGKRPRVQTECQFTIECWKTETNRYIIARLNSHRQFRGPGGRRHLQGNACVMSRLLKLRPMWNSSRVLGLSFRDLEGVFGRRL